MNLGSTFFIVSVYQNNLTEAVNLSNNLTTYQALKHGDLHFKAGEGVYNNIKELNFVIYDLKNEHIVKEIARTFHQESYLTVYQDKAAELVYLSGLTKFIGTFTAVNETEALNNDSYTLVDNTYYICK